MLGDVLKMKLDEVWVGSTNLSLKSARVSRLAFSSIGDYVFTHNGFLNFIFGNTHLPNSPLLSAFARRFAVRVSRAVSVVELP